MTQPHTDPQQVISRPSPPRSRTALFVSRYRHELLHGHEPEEAAGRAVGTAGSAVVFAGATVVIALAALSVVGIPFLTQMGLAAAGTVLFSVLIALTLLPWKTATTAPKATATLSRNPAVALSGTSRLRNTSIRSRNASPTTTAR